jgi:hypothetical protein
VNALPSRKTCALVVAVAAGSVVATGAAGTHAGDREGRLVFRGSGTTMLRPFEVSRPSTMFWVAKGGIFQTFAGGTTDDGSVNSQAARGWTYLPRGRYRLQVNTIGSWSIRIAPGVVRPKLVGRGRLEYSGSGGMALPPIVSRHGGTLRWHAEGGLFQIFAPKKGGTGNVHSNATSGSTYLSPGSHTLAINTTGRWSISWKP